MQPIPCHFHYDCSSQLLPIQNSPRVTSSNEKPVWRSATFSSTDFPPLTEKLMGLRRHFGSGGGALCSDFQKRTQRERTDGRTAKIETRSVHKERERLRGQSAIWSLARSARWIRGAKAVSLTGVQGVKEYLITFKSIAAEYPHKFKSIYSFS